MLLIPQILVRTIALGASAVALAACGQQGPLYLPPTGTTDPATVPKSVPPSVGKFPTSTTGSSTFSVAPQPATVTSAP
ncbi:MAG: lipoprotein [Rhodoferax sp.]|nr:lipoprotein [Rhodoferax sp.]